ncbi:Atf-2 [Drosophila busckii]|uniref:Atf-2 n=1 Tax=Drosophila busckii TaxID=30019 RepID=A0A0M3QUT4_DROBS|nr:protein cab-1 [Drosophila busckii]ALC41219.1 Atf-2 [Drosophila busckii]
MSEKRMEMRCAFVAVVVCSILGHCLCEMSIYPGLRRRPIQPTVLETQQYEQLMEEHARRRLQQQFEQQLELIKLKMIRQRELLERERYRQRQQQARLAAAEAAEDYDNNNNINNNENQQYDQYDNAEAEASYGGPLDVVPDVRPPPMPMQLPLPNYETMQPNSVLRDRIPFAVNPNDARFYENLPEPSGELDSRALDDYEEYAPAPDAAPEVVTSKSKLATAVPAPVPVEPPKLLDTGNANFHRIKPQSAAAAAVAGVNLPQTKDAPNQLNALIDKLTKQSKLPQSELQGHVGETSEQFVLRQHLGMNSEMGVYIVALVAGVSAAITVGLLALGVSWFHNRHKAAADVDYPAYGVTGPNKDVSPSCDRKLAQSAQMYHYQHQKQQIIAMENCQATDGSCGLSDVESDDDNEEGDYTVYECPGLAPTGEMEVKNPLFLDETPATPATGAAAAATTNGVATTAAGSNNNITQATPQQPATQKKGTVKPNMNLLNAAANAAAAAAAAAEEKQKRKSKK